MSDDADIGRPLNYFGSKERMCLTIHALIPPGPSTWVDLFCGSGIVTLRKPRHAREVMNDLNGDVVNLFDVLRGPSSADLFRLIELTPFSEEVLYRCYDADPSGDSVERAWQFLVTSWFSRGGDAHRTGLRWSKGANVSPEMAWTRLPSRLVAVANRLRGVCIRKADALKILADYDDPDCILFIDPPYPGSVGRRYAVKMVNDQHEALAKRLATCRARVILTMNPETVYGELLRGWTETRVRVQGNGHTNKAEVIMTNFEPLPLLAAGMPGSA